MNVKMWYEYKRSYETRKQISNEINIKNELQETVKIINNEIKEYRKKYYIPVTDAVRAKVCNLLEETFEFVAKIELFKGKVDGYFLGKFIPEEMIEFYKQTINEKVVKICEIILENYSIEIVTDIQDDLKKLSIYLTQETKAMVDSLKVQYVREKLKKNYQKNEIINNLFFQIENVVNFSTYGINNVNDSMCNCVRIGYDYMLHNFENAIGVIPTLNDKVFVNFILDYISEYCYIRAF